MSRKHFGPQRASQSSRSIYVTDKWTKQPSVAPKGHRRCSSIAHSPMRFEANQVASKVDYTSVYKNDFQAWKVKRRLPYKLTDSLKVNQGLVVTEHPSKGRFQLNSVQVAANSKPVPQPFESVTSYRSDYVTHPVQPTRREAPVYHTIGLLSQPAVSLKPKVAWAVNQAILDEASALFREFKTWSLENKFHGKGKAKESSPPADHCNFLSTTRADYTEHKCQRAKPVLPSKQTRETSKRRFCGTTTMKEDYKSWDMPQRFPSVRKDELDRPEKTTFSLCTPQTAEGRKTTRKPFRHHPKSNERASSCNATNTTRCPAENGALSNLERNSPGTQESRMHWTSSLDRGGTLTDGRICEEPPQAHQIIHCMVSSRS
ncbi:stabilizer of axonemal microtubules 2 isoform X2 [Cebidichthys violaceus]|uniref:stabilizer of axonemal microtubules 2 isoform X2 n=1 Tax=Cebidichthys violaceus TaxID=271503 RepID=UPI0035CA1F2B